MIKKRPKVTSMWAAGIVCADSWHWNRRRCRRTWLEKERNVCVDKHSAWLLKLTQKQTHRAHYSYQ